ncbi:MAG: Spy/CpxP family protein refolding chaperone [Bacteroidota bacterium]
MKRLILILCIAVTGVAAHAQRGDRPPSPEQMIARATEELDLTQDQVSQWEAIHEKYGEQMKSARQDREQRKALREEIEVEINAILNNEQQVKFAEMKKNRPKRGRRGG